MKAIFGVGILVGLVVIAGLSWFFMGMHYRNREVELRNAITAKQKYNESVFDNTWKIVQQQAQVADQYKEAFKEIYKGLMEGRHYEAGGQFMKFIKEANPKFDVGLYKKLMTSIEGQRAIKLRNDGELLTLKQEHDNVIGTEPSSWFVGSRGKIDVVIVTSTVTNEAFKTGKEDDIDLFKKKTEPVSNPPVPAEKK
jgi:hypothetical protein